LISIELMEQDKRPKVVVIAGPTASGKTSIGVKLALALEGEVINADSMQVFRGMDIGTAKPTPDEQKGIPHHLLDVVDPDEEFNAAIYRRMSLSLIADISSSGRTCFIVGGTGLYIKGLLEGLFQCPRSDPVLREALYRECETLGIEALYKRLKLSDPLSARKIHINDKMRIIRALEIIHLTKRIPSDLSGAHGFRDRPLNALRLCLDVEREQLYNRINERSEVMVHAGLAAETEKLLLKGYSPDLKPMKAIGYRHMVNYLNGTWSLMESIDRIKRDTRRYAKRQITWFRADPEVNWIASENFNLILKKVQTFLRR